MIYATSDLHGTPLPEFLQLLESAGFSDYDTLYVLGDVIDRNGDGGIELLQWIIDRPNMEMILGNHEAMLLECDFLFAGDPEEQLRSMSSSQLQDLMRWDRNGARPTIRSLAGLRERDPEACGAILEYLRGLPLYREITVQGSRYLLVHSGLGNFDPAKKLSDYERDELIWHRPTAEERYFPDMRVILGHTPTGYLFGEEGRMYQTDTWIDIDTGAAGGDSPMLLRLDDLKAFYAAEKPQTEE